jgi:hypothetical protein
MSNPIRPDHYMAKGRKIEPIAVINDWDLNFNCGNVIKYIGRMGLKKGNPLLQDLKKARQYLDFEIERVSGVGCDSHNTCSKQGTDVPVQQTADASDSSSGEMS